MNKDEKKTYRFFSRMETTYQVLWWIVLVGTIITVIGTLGLVVGILLLFWGIFG